MSSSKSDQDKANQPVVHQFWVSSYPFCEASLILCPSTDLAEIPPTIIRVFDADGGAVNELEIGSEAGVPLVVEVDSLLEGCKLEAGLRHARLSVTCHEQIRPVCRLFNRASATLIGPARPVTHEIVAFAPVLLAKDCSTLVTLLNPGVEDAQVRVRLLFGTRSPDLVRVIPAGGARVVCLEQDFRDAVIDATIPKGEAAKVRKADRELPETRGYVRVSVRNTQKVLAQVVEAIDRGAEGTSFSAISW